MNRTNLILLLLLAGLVGAYFLTADKPGGPGDAAAAARLFPAFNKEAADSIVIEGGWPKSRYEFERGSAGWALASAGGYPVRRETVDKVLDATWNLMRENLVGTSDELAADTQTGDLGRIVRVFQGGKPMAEFRIGKNPPSGWEEVYVRKEGAPEIFRARTVLTKEKNLVGAGNDPFSVRGRGFDWHNHLILTSNEWLERKIWDLSSAEVQEMQLSREGGSIDLARKGQEEWEIRAPEAGPADTDAVNGIFNAARDLELADVLGKYDAVAKQYGLDHPEISLVMTLRKKVEKKEEPKKEGEAEKKEEEAKPEEYVTWKRWVNVGKAIKRPDRYEEEEKQVKEADYYPVSVGGDPFESTEEKSRSEFVFLVRDWKLSGLRKKIEDLKQKAPEKPVEGCGSGDAEKPAEPEKPAEEGAKPGDGGEKPSEGGGKPGEGGATPPETPPEAPPQTPESPEPPKDPPPPE